MNHAVGIDLSLTSTGVATHLGQCNVFSAPGDFGHPMERYGYILDEILKVTDSVAHVQGGTLPHVAIEGYAFAKRSSHAHAQGELGGIVRRGLWTAGIRWVEVPPTNLKKFITGKGNATKTDIVSAVTLKTGVEWSGKGADDRADAWGLRQMVLAHFNESEYSWPAKSLEALEKVAWGTLDD